VIGIHCYCAIPCQRSARDRRIGQKADARERQNISYERRTRTQCGRAADLPEVIALLPAIDEKYRRIAARNKSAAYLEYPDSIDVASAIQIGRASCRERV